MQLKRNQDEVDEDCVKAGLTVRSGHMDALKQGGWLNDELMNFFIERWGRGSATVLAFGTFFASKFLFDTEACVIARSEFSPAMDKLLKKCLHKRMVCDLFAKDCTNVTNWYHLDISGHRP